jgi:hypothetical protein
MVDWYYDKLSGDVFVNALRALRKEGEVVRALSALEKSAGKVYTHYSL